MPTTARRSAGDNGVPANGNEDVNAKRRRTMTSTEQAVAILEAGRQSLEQIGEGDWTPQDNFTLLALNALEVLLQERDQLIQQRRDGFNAAQVAQRQVSERDQTIAALPHEEHCESLLYVPSHPGYDCTCSKSASARGNEE